MPNPILLTVSDTAPDLVATMWNASTRQDLTGITSAELRLKRSGTTQTFTATPNADATDGVLTVTRGQLSSVTAGVYAAEYRVTFGDGTIGTFPTPNSPSLDVKFEDRRT